MRQLCNIVFTASLENMDEVGREEFLRELDMPLDPMKQAEMIMKAGG